MPTLVDRQFLGSAFSRANRSQSRSAAKYGWTPSRTRGEGSRDDRPADLSTRNRSREHHRAVARVRVPGHEGMGVEFYCDLAMLVIELVIGLLGGGS